MRTESRVRVGLHTLTMTNLDKVLYPDAGFTKREVIEYYYKVSRYMLPHLRGRPLTMKRFPDGVEGESFYEKRCPDFRPEWVSVSPIRSDGESEAVEYCLVNTTSALLWVANLAALELHTLLSRHPDPDRPTMMVFDLDPGQPAGLLDAARAALDLRDALQALGLRSYAKTSGGKGLHAYVPLNTPATWEQSKRFAQGVAQALERQRPSELTSSIRKAERRGKVLIDWSQNDRHKTTVCAYSLRAGVAALPQPGAAAGRRNRPRAGRERRLVTPGGRGTYSRPTVSTPVTWDEIEGAVMRKDAAALVFGPADVLKRVEEKGDLFRPTLQERQRLPGAVKGQLRSAVRSRAPQDEAKGGQTVVSPP